MTELFANNAASVLVGGISSSATSLTVASATAFPGSGNFRILVDSGANLEYMLVTGVAGAVFTVTRGIEGTTGVAHLAGTQVVQVLTKGGLAQTIADNLSGGSTQWSQSVTAGGTIAYAGPSPVPPTVILTGTPSAGFTFTWPTGNFETTLFNVSTHNVATGGASNPGAFIIPPLTGGVAAPSFTMAAGYLVPMTTQQGNSPWEDSYIYGDSTYGPTAGVTSLAGENNSTPGVVPLVTNYGAIAQDLPCAAFGVTPPNVPNIPSGSGIFRWTTDPAVTATTVDGWLAQEINGFTRVVCPHVYFPHASYSTQQLTEGGVVFADTLTGPSASEFGVFALPIGVTHAKVICLARVVSTSGSSETVGDSFTASSEIAWTNIAGTVATATLLQGQIWEFVGPPGSATPASLAGMVFTLTDNALTLAKVTYATAGTLHASTVVDIQIHIVPAVTL